MMLRTMIGLQMSLMNQDDKDQVTVTVAIELMRMRI